MPTHRDGSVVDEEIKSAHFRSNVSNARFNGVRVDLVDLHRQCLLADCFDFAGWRARIAETAQSLVAWFEGNAAADGVQSTPSFVIDGTLYRNMAYDEMQGLIDAALGG